MHRNAEIRRRFTSVLFALITVFALAVPVFAQAQRKGNVIFNVSDPRRVGELASKHGLTIRKVLTRGNSATIVVDARDARALKVALRREKVVSWVADDAIITLGSGETVLPLGNGETVLPLSGGETVLPLGPISPTTSSQTIAQLLGNGETVLPLGSGETVLPLGSGETVLPLDEMNVIMAAYAKLASLVNANERLLIQPNLRRIGLYYAAQSSATGLGVTIADLDTGADTCHEVLSGIMTYSFVDGGAAGPENCPTATTPVVPGYGHGTAVGSLIRIVAPEATLWSLRVFDDTGAAQVSDIYAATVFAVDQGVDIINMSFGTPAYSEALDDAVKYALTRGVLVFAAAGNSGDNQLLYPARLPGVQAVVATYVPENADVKAAFSNYGKEVFVSAPGVKSWVAYPNHQIAQANGTSFAAPLVAAQAALIMDAYRRNGLNPNKHAVKQSLLWGLTPIEPDPSSPWWGKTGAGRIYVPYSLLPAYTQ